MFRKQNAPTSGDPALVVGLGRFGAAAARRLDELGVEVIAVDRDAALVARLATTLDNVAVVDATDEEAMAQIGLDHVIYPEHAAGVRVAHAVARHLIDYFEFEDGFAVARISAPGAICHQSLAESDVRSRHHVTVVGLKREGEPFQYAVPETVILPGDQLILPGDQLILTGTKPDLDRFAALG
ncbi:potassium channel family protein [Luteococcus sp. Sow4_B9]|uniref:potassium channel family protein n=1 Tax=Luteococcus sp. Sow4_B9 TaxID=3438792 RepID=UPI003F9DBE26